MATVQISGLTRYFGDLAALNGLSFSLGSGRIVGLMGENGSGKTTLLKILAGVLSDYEGEATILGHRPGPQTKDLVSFLPDESFLPDNITGDYAIEMYRDFFADFDENKARDLIRYFRLDSRQQLKAMSKGMREKLQISLAISRQAKVYLLDEPISGVDPAAREVILGGILRVFAEDALMLISTHLISDVENIVDEAIFLREGRLVLQGEADQLRAEHGKGIDALFREVFACSTY